MGSIYNAGDITSKSRIELINLFSGVGKIVRDYDKSSISLLIDRLFKKIELETNEYNITRLLRGSHFRIKSKTKRRNQLNFLVRSSLTKLSENRRVKSKVRSYIINSKQLHLYAIDKNINDEDFEIFLYNQVLELAIKEISNQEYLNIEIRYKNLVLYKLKQTLLKIAKREISSKLLRDIGINTFVSAIVEITKSLSNIKNIIYLGNYKIGAVSVRHSPFIMFKT